jgi:hypothetical protein
MAEPTLARTEIIRSAVIDAAMKEDVTSRTRTTATKASRPMLSFARDRMHVVKCALAQGDRACGGRVTGPRANIRRKAGEGSNKGRDFSGPFA